MLSDKDIVEIIKKDYDKKISSKEDKKLQEVIDKNKYFFKKNLENQIRLKGFLIRLLLLKDIQVNEVMCLDLEKVLFFGKEYYHEYITSFFKKERKLDENIFLFNILLNNKIEILNKQKILQKILSANRLFDYKSKEGYLVNEFIKIKGNEIKNYQEFNSFFLSDDFLEAEEKYKQQNNKYLNDMSSKQFNNQNKKYIFQKIEIKEYCELDKNNEETMKEKIEDLYSLNINTYEKEDVVVVDKDNVLTKREKEALIIKEIEDNANELFNSVSYLNKNIIEEIKDSETKRKIKEKTIEEMISGYIIKPLEKYSRFQEYKVKELLGINDLVKEKINEITMLIEKEKDEKQNKEKELNNIYLYKKEIEKIIKNIDLFNNKRNILSKKEIDLETNQQQNIKDIMEINKYMFEIEKLEKIKERMLNMIKIVDTQLENKNHLILNSDKQIMNAEDAIYGLYPVFEKSLENYLEYVNVNNLEKEKNNGTKEIVFSMKKNVNKIMEKISNIFEKNKEEDKKWIENHKSKDEDLEKKRKNVFSIKK
jgi:hypothetical protein